MKQLTIKLPKNELRQLSQIAAERMLSKREVIAEAIAVYLVEHTPIPQANALKKSFGIWRVHSIDGVKFQRMLREEW